MCVFELRIFGCLRAQGARHYLNMSNEREAMNGVRRLFDAADAAGMMLFSKVRRGFPVPLRYLHLRECVSVHFRSTWVGWQGRVLETTV